MQTSVSLSEASPHKIQNRDPNNAITAQSERVATHCNAHYATMLIRNDGALREGRKTLRNKLSNWPNWSNRSDWSNWSDILVQVGDVWELDVRGLLFLCICLSAKCQSDGSSHKYLNRARSTTKSVAFFSSASLSAKLFCISVSASPGTGIHRTSLKLFTSGLLTMNTATPNSQLTCSRAAISDCFSIISCRKCRLWRGASDRRIRSK